MIIQIILGDITSLTADAIVNAANSSLLGGGGVDGAIHRKGGPAILEACKVIRARQGGCQTGDAVITTAGNLPARYVIHTVGPIWHGGNREEAALLENCYFNALALADAHEVKTIAFPNISTGVYDYPKLAAATVAWNAVHHYFDSRTSGIELVSFVCFELDNFQYYLNLYQEHHGKFNQ